MITWIFVHILLYYMENFVLYGIFVLVYGKFDKTDFL